MKDISHYTEEEWKRILSLLQAPPPTLVAEDKLALQHAISWMVELQQRQALETIYGSALPAWIPTSYFIQCQNAYRGLWISGLEDDEIVSLTLSFTISYHALSTWCRNKTERFGLHSAFSTLLTLHGLKGLDEKNCLVVLYGKKDGLALWRGRSYSGRKQEAAHEQVEEAIRRRAALRVYMDEWNASHPSGSLHGNKSAMARALETRIGKNDIPPALIDFELPKGLRKLLGNL